MKMRIVADSSANLLEMKDVEFASVVVLVYLGGSEGGEHVVLVGWDELVEG